METRNEVPSFDAMDEILWCDDSNEPPSLYFPIVVFLQHVIWD